MTYKEFYDRAIWITQQPWNAETMTEAFLELANKFNEEKLKEMFDLFDKEEDF